VADPVPAQVAVGDYVSFNVTVTNAGDGTARGILIKDQYDRGLKHLEDQRNQFAIEYPIMRDLPPGESETIPLTFQVIDSGMQCHRVTVSAEGVEAVTARGCVTARQATLEVTVTGERSHIVGERATFRAVVKNVGDVAAKNVAIVARYDEALNPVEADRGYESLPDGGIQLRFDSMEPSEQRTFTVVAECRSPASSACMRFLVSADGGVTAADEACIEILAPRSPPGTPGAAAPDLRITITENANPARSGQRLILVITLANAGQQAASNVALSVLLPPQLTPDATQIQPAGEATIAGPEVKFSAIPQLDPQAERPYLIPVTVGQPGDVRVRAAATASGLTDFIRAESNLIKIIPQ
jgi:uncharacterized repeat protein (TIGR01451 family)